VLQGYSIVLLIYGLTTTSEFLGCLMLPSMPFRLREDEKESSEELLGIQKSISDVTKEVF
jgi:hypothetical protein